MHNILPAYFEQARRIQYYDQMLYTSVTIVIGQAGLPISVSRKKILTSLRCTFLKLTSNVGLKRLNNIITQIHSLGNEMEGLKSQ